MNENYQLAALSAALNAGMADPLNGPIDAGLFSAPFGGPAGRDDLGAAALFYPATSTPAVGQNLGTNQSILIAFLGGALDAGSVNPQSVRVLNAGGALIANTTAFLQGGELRIDPPGAGWPAGELLVELHRTLRSNAGVDIATPLALRFFRP